MIVVRAGGTGIASSSGSQPPASRPLGDSAADRPAAAPPRAAGFGSLVGTTKFAYIDACRLAQAMNAGRAPTEADHRGKCNHVACPACGGDGAARLARRVENAADAIEGRTAEFLLTWPNLPCHSASVGDVLAFFKAARHLVRWLKGGGRFARLLVGSLGTSHFNFVPGSGGKFFQPHLHLAVVLRLDDPDAVQMILEIIWTRVGGDQVILGKRQPDGTLTQFSHYLRKHPVRPAKNEPVDPATLDAWRRELHERVLDRVERMLRRQAAFGIATGVYAGKAHSRVAARGRFEALATDDERERSPDRNAPPLPAGVHRVLLRRSCPQCRAPHRFVIGFGRTAAGTPRFRCNRCRATFIKTHRSIYAPKYLPHSRILVSDARRMNRRHAAGESIAAIARDERRHRATVRRAVEYVRRITPVRTGTVIPRLRTDPLIGSSGPPATVAETTQRSPAARAPSTPPGCPSANPSDRRTIA